MSVLGFLAAVMPIVASLYAAGSYLLEQSRLRHEEWVRYRVKRMVERRRELEEGWAQALGRNTWGNSWTPHKLKLLDFEAKMLLAHGVVPQIITYRDHDVRLNMSGSMVGELELRRQRALIVGSVIGVVLLGVDAAGIGH